VPQHGDASVTDAGLVRYTPTAGYHGPDALTAQVTDRAGAAATVAIDVTVQAADPTPAPAQSSGGGGGADPGSMAVLLALTWVAARFRREVVYPRTAGPEPRIAAARAPARYRRPFPRRCAGTAPSAPRPTRYGRRRCPRRSACVSGTSSHRNRQAQDSFNCSFRGKCPVWGPACILGSQGWYENAAQRSGHHFAVPPATAVRHLPP
jgi:hypothetical protein